MTTRELDNKMIVTRRSTSFTATMMQIFTTFVSGLVTSFKPIPNPDKKLVEIVHRWTGKRWNALLQDAEAAAKLIIPGMYDLNHHLSWQRAMVCTSTSTVYICV